MFKVEKDGKDNLGEYFPNYIIGINYPRRCKYFMKRSHMITHKFDNYYIPHHPLKNFEYEFTLLVLLKKSFS